MVLYLAAFIVNFICIVKCDRGEVQRTAGFILCCERNLDSVSPVSSNMKLYSSQGQTTRKKKKEKKVKWTHNIRGCIYKQ